MGLSVCMRCLKYLVFIFNLIFWLAGMGVLVSAIYLRCDPQAIQDSSDEGLNLRHTGTYILMGVGGLMTIVGFFGCCGAYQESPCLLACFFACVLVILGGEIAGGVWAYLNKDVVKSYLTEEFTDVIKSQYNISKTKTDAFDTIQTTLKCCGADDKYNWLCSYYALQSETELCELSDRGDIINLKMHYPPSCCTAQGVLEVGVENCGDSSKWVAADKAEAVKKEGLYIHPQGCVPAVESLFYQHTDEVIATLIGLAIIEVLGMAFAIALCCSLRCQYEEQPYGKA